MGLPSVPEPYSNAIRIAIAVGVACFIGYGVVLPSEGIHVTFSRQFSQASKWAAITCVVVNAPVIGKVAQTGAERILGTVAGGTLGFFTYKIGRMFWHADTRSDGAILSIAAALVAFSSIVLGKLLNLAYSAKLYAIAFLIVTFGAVDEETTDTSVFLLASMRVLGIASGVLLSEVAAVLIFPRSATQEAVAKMALALGKLAELNRTVWVHGPWQATHRPSTPSAKTPRGDGYVALPEDDIEDARMAEYEKQQERLEEESEKLLMAVYDALYKVQEQVPLAAAEVYLFTYRGHLCLLPGLPWIPMGRWRLPKAEMEQLATTVRKVARLLWALHLSFMDGFDENMINLLAQHYPSELMPQLALHSQGALDAAAAAFPKRNRVDASSLQLFVSAVEGLMRISDFQRRRILQLIKHYRTVRKARSYVRAQSMASSYPISRADGAMRTAGGSPVMASSMPLPVSAGLGSPPPGKQQAAGTSEELHAGRAGGGCSRLAAASHLQTVPERRRTVIGNAVGDALESSNTDEVMLDDSVGDKDAPGRVPNQEEAVQGKRTSSSLTEALLAADAAQSPAQDVTAQAHPPEALGMQRALDWTLNRSFVGTPFEAFRDLPEGLHIALEGGAARLPGPLGKTPGMGLPATSSWNANRAFTLRLQRVPSSELVEFPENEEGHLAKVRWYSFQFLLSELAYELEDMQVALDNLLAILSQAMGGAC